jgi:hypothetical protein
MYNLLTIVNNLVICALNCRITLRGADFFFQNKSGIAKLQILLEVTNEVTILFIS